VCSSDKKDAETWHQFLGVSEIRWNSCGRMRIATGETVLHSGNAEGENHKSGVGFILSKEASQCLLDWEPVYESQVQLEESTGHHLAMLFPNK